MINKINATNQTFNKIKPKNFSANIKKAANALKDNNYKLDTAFEEKYGFFKFGDRIVKQIFPR